MGLLLAKINKHLTIVPIATMIETTTQSETIRTIFLFFMNIHFQNSKLNWVIKRRKTIHQIEIYFLLQTFLKFKYGSLLLTFQLILFFKGLSLKPSIVFRTKPQKTIFYPYYQCLNEGSAPKLSRSPNTLQMIFETHSSVAATMNKSLSYGNR